MTIYHMLQVIVVKIILIHLKNDLIKLLKWFADNQMKVNKNKCHLLVSGSENTANVDANIIGKINCEKLFNVNVDYKLKFNEHLDRILIKHVEK